MIENILIQLRDLSEEYHAKAHEYRDKAKRNETGNLNNDKLEWYHMAGIAAAYDNAISIIEGAIHENRN
jgi:hypothetical protein